LCARVRPLAGMKWMRVNQELPKGEAHGFTLRLLPSIPGNSGRSDGGLPPSLIKIPSLTIA
jgi:hypothetical protein